MDTHDLHGVEQTLFLPLLVKAGEHLRRRPILSDRAAADLVARLALDKRAYRLNPFSSLGVLFRARKFDSYVTEYLQARPRGTVIEIGAGLDTRFARTDNGTAQWVFIDLPNVIALRKKLFPVHERIRLCDTPIGEIDWKKLCPHEDRPLIISEGCLIYVERNVVLDMVAGLGRAFPGANLCFDVASDFVIRRQNIRTLKRNDVTLAWGVDDIGDLLAEAKGCRLIEEWRYYDRFEWRNGILNLFRFFPRLNNLFRIVKLQLGSA